MDARRKAFATLSAAAVLTACSNVEAGNLEPPGAPGSTMVTMIRAVPFPISSPGLYALEGDIDAAGGGITISASNVTLDLRGHSLRNGSGDGVVATAGQVNITVKNGIISGWGDHCVDLTLASNSTVMGIHAEGCLGTGIEVGNGSLVQSCLAVSNGLGIRANDGSTITDCIARQNGSFGIFADSGVTITRCTATSNDSTGIHMNSGGTITHCTAVGNGLSPGPGDDEGIRITDGGLISGNSVFSNAGHGIEVNTDSTVVGNNCSDNGSSGDGAGIHVTGSDNRIDGNHVVDNDRGIDVDAAGNIIIRNTASGNTGPGAFPLPHYDIAPSNSVGQILDVTGVEITTTNPWRNLVF